MTFEHYWSALVKHWALIVICFLAVGTGAFVGSKFMTPIYQSSALVQVMLLSNNSQADYNSLLASDQLVQTEAILATSDPVLRAVASHYQGLPTQQIAKEVTATSKLNTQLFEIDVQDASPTQAAALANDIATTLIQQQLQVFNQSTAQSGDFMLLVQPAQPPLTPIRPNKLINTAGGLLIGLLMGMLLVLLFELLDRRVRNPEALSQLLDWPILTTLWLAQPSKKGEGLIFNPTVHSANVEPFRILRTNIGFTTIEKPQRSIVVTSTSPLEGKSTVAANLAISMAMAGKTTLLIDADLRRPTLQHLFGLSPEKKGLSNAIQAFSMLATTTPKERASILSPPISLDPFIHTVVDIPNLYIMPSGSLPPNPPDLLASKAMLSLFAALTKAEAIIFDTPPLLGLSDARILASKADATLVVVDITHANKKALEQAKTLLAQAGAYVSGCVVNKQHRRRNDKTYSYYYKSAKQQEESHRTENTLSPAVLPAPPESLKQSKILYQQDDRLDQTIRLPTRNIKKHVVIPSRPVDIKSQPDMLNGRKDG